MRRHTFDALCGKNDDGTGKCSICERAEAEAEDKFKLDHPVLAPLFFDGWIIIFIIMLSIMIAIFCGSSLR